MHDKIFIDPRIRDYVFLPLVFLMFNLQVLRLMAMRYMNEPKNKLLEKAKLSYATLFGTIFEKDADKERRMPDEQVEIVKMLEERTDTDARETQALARSKKVRSKAEWLPEGAIKNRKQFYCKEGEGYLNRQIAAANPMNMM